MGEPWLDSSTYKKDLGVLESSLINDNIFHKSPKDSMKIMFRPFREDWGKAGGRQWSSAAATCNRILFSPNPSILFPGISQGPQTARVSTQR